MVSFSFCALDVKQLTLNVLTDITRQDIQEADARVGESARGLLDTIRDTYSQKKHGNLAILA